MELVQGELELLLTRWHHYLQTDAGGLNELAKNYQMIYPIASRCGVFAKTDVQPLINEGANKEDIAISIFQAVSQSNN